jgi:predicted N-acyltransferase
VAVSDAAPPLEIRTHASMRDMGQAVYESVLPEGRPPFLSFAWLDALERTGCVGEERGWLPQHISLYEHGQCVAVAPAYVKTNSEGEFVFDYAWARHSEGVLRAPYYPKLVLAVPFTPATGPRILIRPDVDQAHVLSAFARALPQLCAALTCCSCPASSRRRSPGWGTQNVEVFNFIGKIPDTRALTISFRV